MYRFLTLLIMIFHLITVVSSASAEENSINAIVTIIPQSYFLNRIAGDLVNVETLVRSNQDPHSFEPTPKLMKSISEADVYFTIGLPMEAILLNKLDTSKKHLLIVDTREGIEINPIDEADHHEDHHHNYDGDPHVWLDPLLAKIQARNMADALIAIDSTNKSIYKDHLISLQEDLDSLHIALAEKLNALEHRTFFTYHPAFGYFFAIDIVYISYLSNSPGKNPVLNSSCS